MACNEAVYLAGVLLVIEYFGRIGNTDSNFETNVLGLYTLFFILTFITCTISALKFTSFFENESLKGCTAYLYMLDSVAAIALGCSLMKSSIMGVIVSMLFLTNFFMLHVINKIFVGEKPVGLAPQLSALLKTYIHHTASFLFLDLDDSVGAMNVIALTTIWRALSMSGHTAQSLSLKKIISSDTLFQFNWILSHARNVFVATLFYLCYQYPHIRHSFARSAIGHVAYILVRAGPVFRLGSVYVGDRPLWQSLTDVARLRTLATGRHPFLTLEVGSLTMLAVFFLYLRCTADSTSL